MYGGEETQKDYEDEAVSTGKLVDIIGNTCTRYLWERTYDGKLNPTCIGCNAVAVGRFCPLGNASPDKDPFAAIRITKVEAIRRLERRRDEWNHSIDKMIEELN